MTTLCRTIFQILIMTGFPILTFGITPADSTSEPEEISTQFIDSLRNSFRFQTGTIQINELAEIKVPRGFKYLDAEQSKKVLTELWGNPPDNSTLGMLFLENASPVDDYRWAVEISYSEEGYIKDDDAEDLDYDDLLEEMQKDCEDANPSRKTEGYPEVHLLGWASPPFYDQENKKLHWAKELRFGDTASASTLNYNIRVLGRKGYLNLNAIGGMDQLSDIKKNINTVLASVEFKEGNKYSNFNPDLDEVAAYGIGGLIAGKVLAKVGLFVLLAKFWKVIALAVVGFFALLKKKFFGSKDDNSVAEESGS
ncbi:MAG TPA: DUF2167 domain-containing protein [Cytophagaceae bacterium]